MLNADRSALFTALLACLLNLPWSAAAQIRHESPKDKEIRLTVGRSLVLDRTDEVRRVAIADERVADVVAVSTRELLINGKAPGITSLVLWSASGDRELLTISVRPNIEQLREHIREAFPGEAIGVVATKGVITLRGKASSRAVVEKVKAMTATVGP